MPGGPAPFSLYQAQSFIGTPRSWHPFLNPPSLPQALPPPGLAGKEAAVGKHPARGASLAAQGPAVTHPLNSPEAASQPPYWGEHFSAPFPDEETEVWRVPGTPTSHAHECTMELSTLSLDTQVDADEAENVWGARGPLSHFSKTRAPGQHPSTGSLSTPHKCIFCLPTFVGPGQTPPSPAISKLSSHSQLCG